MEKVLFDTDIGTDIDDALALAYLLCQPECDLLGVTTVSGDVTARAKLVSAVCKRAGRNLPIYPGCSDCIATPQIEPYVPQDQILSDFDHDTVFPQGEAIEFMRRTIRENPGEVTLIAVGPMTNIASRRPSGFYPQPPDPNRTPGLYGHEFHCGSLRHQNRL